jgi:transcriptional regulator with XRE-family HTH domain
MSVTTQQRAPENRRWDVPAYRRISSATPRGDTLVVLFEDGSWVEVDRAQIIRPEARGVRWGEATATPYEIVVPTAGDPIEIPWSTIRAVTDREYSAYLAETSDEEAQQIGLRIRELRERRGLGSKELAERAGITPQSLSRIEHGKHDIVFTTLRRILAAMDYSLADLVVAPREPASVSAVMKRLIETGLDRDLILRRLLPRRLRDRVAGRTGSGGVDEGPLAEQLAAAVGGVFGWSAAAILRGESLSLGRALPEGVRFKMAIGADEARAAAYAAYAHVLARIVHTAAQVPDIQPMPDDPDVLRAEVIDRYGAFTFEALLRYTWDLGIPVIPLRDPGAFHGACWLVDERPVIVLKQVTDAQARWMFDLLHELKHVASHLNAEHPAFVEDEEISPHAPAGEERQASRFAGAAILFGRAEELTQRCVAEAGGATERLKWAVQRVAEAEHVPDDALANYIAFRMSRQGQNWWGTANNLQVTHPAAWVIARDLLLEHLDKERLDPRARALLGRALLDGGED